MGMNLVGLDPAEEIGAGFDNNVWGWRPLWGYVCTTCEDLLTPQQMDGGHFNDGTEITVSQALQIAERLHAELENGGVRRYATERLEALQALPDEKCHLCGGTGNGQRGTCSKCKGTGKVRPTTTLYWFDEENVREFADFCATCGGFKIY